ncbi:HAMP domain-containing protein [Iocasia frigidifontis]|uniref:HAMP domain-containing protein n=2 Tax=Iocasia fonsfrigidae TaxID=2682810 RepID=A0A8A7KHB7_9FIRM|nr:HAMP domain-containing protein [Iocasia fonsfrigidae]
MDIFISAISKLYSFRGNNKMIKKKNPLIRISDLKSSIAAKVIIIVAITMLISFFLLGWSINRSISVKLTDLTEQSNMEIAKILNKEIASFLDEAEGAVLRLSKDYGLRSNDQVKIVAKSKFSSELEENNYFQSIYYVSSDDKIVIPERKLADYNYQEEKWFQLAKESNKPVWTTSSKKINEANYTLSLAVPVYDYTDKFMGVLGADISLESLTSILNWNIGKNGCVSLIDSQGKVITISEKEGEQAGTVLSLDTDLNQIYQNELHHGIYRYKNEEYLMSFQPLKKINAAVITMIPFAEAYEAKKVVRMQIFIFALIVLLVMTVTITMIIDYQLIKPLLIIKDRMQEVAAGNLRGRIEFKRQDEIGKLAVTFNRMVRQLKGIITGIHNTAGKVSVTSLNMKNIFQEISTASEAISISTENVSAGTEEQAANIDNVNNEIKKQAGSLNKLAVSNKRVENLTEKMNQAAATGQNEVERVSKQMNNISKAIIDVAEGIKNLQRSSDEIDDILTLINSISKQTNLLALNAAIEAARAGEAGKGFSVVADEIRQLAEESSKSSDRIKGLIDEIKDETKTASQKMAQGNREVSDGAEIAQGAFESFKRIEEAIKDLTEGIYISSAAVAESTENSNMIVSNIENIAIIAEETSASADEVTVTSQEQTSNVQEISVYANELADLSCDLENMVKSFSFQD